MKLWYTKRTQNYESDSWVLFNKKAAAAEIGEKFEVEDGADGQVNLQWPSQGWCENYDKNCDGDDVGVVLRQIARVWSGLLKGPHQMVKLLEQGALLLSLSLSIFNCRHNPEQIAECTFATHQNQTAQLPRVDTRDQTKPQRTEWEGSQKGFPGEWVSMAFDKQLVCQYRVLRLLNIRSDVSTPFPT